MRDKILDKQIEEWWDVFRRFLYAKYPWTKKEVEEEVITPEKFSEYIKNKRDKIWYHALYFSF